MTRAGHCRFCGCTYDRPCPEGCAWMDAAETLCSACAGVYEAWRVLKTRPPTMYRAFFRGFTAGADDERAVDRVGDRRRDRGTAAPAYAKAATQRYWRLGFAEGERFARLPR